MGGMSSSWDDYKASSYDWDSSSSVTKKSAASYSKQDKRIYTGSTTGIKPPVGKDIYTSSPLAAVLMVDITGSMKKWPGLIFNKIPTLYNEANAGLQGLDLEELEKGKKVKDLLEMAVVAVGDVQYNYHPLQVVDFSKGPDLVKGVNKIFPEGCGGGNKVESYDLAAYYLNKHCKTPNIPKGAKPLLIIAGDEGFYEELPADFIRDFTGDNRKKDVNSTRTIEELASRFDTFILRPEENYSASVYANIHKQWQDVLGPQRVLRMNNPQRLVDCVIGICSYAADNFEEGVKILERRQTPQQVKQVLETLHPLTGK
jgi:hypothetical protein